MKVSARAREMPPFLVMEVLDRAATLERQGRSIIHLEVGEPDFDTPAVVVAEAERALRDGKTHYTHSMGRPELREAIAAWHESQYGVATSADQIVVTMGSSGAMLLVFAALLDPGDGILLTDPHYACYPNFITAFDGEAIRIGVREEDGFQFAPEDVAAHLERRPAAIMLNSPANPTGTVLDAERMRRIVEVVGDRATIISDEIYHGLVYRGRVHSVREFAPEAVVVNGFSKLFAMTGWRIGYAILPPSLVRPVQKLQQNLFISPPDYPQYAAIAALEKAGPDVERMRRAYDDRRNLILRRLRAMNLSPLTEPIGAFYVFVNVQRYTDDVHQFAFRLLEEAGVAVTPGVDFGPRGEGYLRFSYANSLANIEEGMNRFAAFLERTAGEAAKVQPDD